MRRIAVLISISVSVLSLVLACGGDDDESSDSDSTSAGSLGTSAPSTPAATSDSSEGSKPADRSSETGGSDSEFCTPDSTDAVFDRLDFTTDLSNIEAQLRDLNDALGGWVDQAPDELKSDVAVLVEAIQGLFELLEENDFDFIAVGTSAADDPRLAALDSAEFQAATDRLSEYCGYDIDPRSDSADSSDVTPPPRTEPTQAVAPAGGTCAVLSAESVENAIGEGLLRTEPAPGACYYTVGSGQVILRVETAGARGFFDRLAQGDPVGVGDEATWMSSGSIGELTTIEGGVAVQVSMFLTAPAKDALEIATAIAQRALDAQ